MPATETETPPPDAPPIASVAPPPPPVQPARVEPAIGAPVAPVVLSADPPAEMPRKRGWWRK
jgi:hypothetical protein